MVENSAGSAITGALAERPVQPGHRRDHHRQPHLGQARNYRLLPECRGNPRGPARRLLRPANYRTTCRDGALRRPQEQCSASAVSSFTGSVFMASNDDPFRIAEVIERDQGQSDFCPKLHVSRRCRKTGSGMVSGWPRSRRRRHAHASSDRRRASRTGGTAYITDVGMTGPYDSVIGVQKRK